MIRAHRYYARNGDDFRIGETSYAGAQSAVHRMESLIRGHGLLLSGSKTVIVRRETYACQLTERDDHIENTKRALFTQAVEKLAEGGEKEVAALIDKADKEELGWGFFYHQNISFDELVEALREHLTPDDIIVADAVFREAITDVGVNKLAPDEFHQRVTFSLVRLTAAHSPAALDNCPDLVLSYPEKTELVAHYLIALTTTHAEQVQTAVLRIMSDAEHFINPWTKAWMFRVLEHCPPSAGKELVEYSLRTAEAEEEPWVARISGVRFLGRLGRLSNELARRIWNLAPVAYRTDLAVAVHSMVTHASWAQPFLDSLQGDVFTVVKRHLGALETETEAALRKPAKKSRRT